MCNSEGCSQDKIEYVICEYSLGCMMPSGEDTLDNAEDKATGLGIKWSSVMGFSHYHAILH